jgi:hypothetical protein
LFGEPTLGYNQLKDVDFDFLLWGHDHSRKETEQVTACAPWRTPDAAPTPSSLSC